MTRMISQYFGPHDHWYKDWVNINRRIPATEEESQFVKAKFHLRYRLFENLMASNYLRHWCDDKLRGQRN